MCQSFARDIDKKEYGFDAMALREALIRKRHRRDQLAAPTQRLKRTLLCFAADQIDDGIDVSNQFLEALCPKVDDRVRSESAQEWNIRRECSRDRSHTRAASQLHRICAHVAGRPVNERCLAYLELRLIEQCLPGRDGNDW